MKFNIIEKNNSIYVNIHLKGSSAPHSFFPLIDSITKQIKDTYLQKKLPVVFDLLDLHVIDSYMISILVQIFRLTAPEKNTVLVSDTQVIDVLTLIGIDKMFDMFNSEEEWLDTD